jgi:hypothetical protein
MSVNNKQTNRLQLHINGIVHTGSYKLKGLDYVIVKELNRFHDTIPASFEKTEGNCG